MVPIQHIYSNWSFWLVCNFKTHAPCLVVCNSPILMTELVKLHSVKPCSGWEGYTSVSAANGVQEGRQLCFSMTVYPRTSVSESWCAEQTCRFADMKKHAGFLSWDPLGSTKDTHWEQDCKMGFHSRSKGFSFCLCFCKRTTKLDQLSIFFRKLSGEMHYLCVACICMRGCLLVSGSSQHISHALEPLNAPHLYGGPFTDQWLTDWVSDEAFNVSEGKNDTFRVLLETWPTPGTAMVYIMTITEICYS